MGRITKTKKPKTAAVKGFRSTYTYAVLCKFVDSFRPKTIGIRLLHVFLLGLLLVAVIFGLVVATKVIGDRVFNRVDVPTNIMALSEPQANLLAANAQNAYLFVIFAPILFFILFTLSFSLFGGTIWCVITRHKFSARFFTWFLLLSTIWFLAWLLLFTGTVLVLGQTLSEHPFASSVVLAFLILLFLHFSLILFILFPFNAGHAGHGWKAIVLSMGSAFKLGVLKIHYFVLPYIIILLIAQPLRLIDWLASKLPQTAYFAISLLVLLLFFAWASLFIASVVEGIKKI